MIQAVDIKEQGKLSKGIYLELMADSNQAKAVSLQNQIEIPTPDQVV